MADRPHPAGGGGLASHGVDAGAGPPAAALGARELPLSPRGIPLTEVAQGGSCRPRRLDQRRFHPGHLPEGWRPTSQGRIGKRGEGAAAAPGGVGSKGCWPKGGLEKCPGRPKAARGSGGGRGLREVAAGGGYAQRRRAGRPPLHALAVAARHSPSSLERLLEPPRPSLVALAACRSLPTHGGRLQERYDPTGLFYAHPRRASNRRPLRWVEVRPIVRHQQSFR